MIKISIPKNLYSGEQSAVHKEHVISEYASIIKEIQKLVTFIFLQQGNIDEYIDSLSKKLYIRWKYWETFNIASRESHNLIVSTIKKNEIRVAMNKYEK